MNLARAGVALGLLGLALAACGRSGSPVPAARTADKETIRFLEQRVQRDTDDFIALNRLAGSYLQRVRETGDLTYLQLASRAARTSLAALPAEQNTGGLIALAQAEYAAHDFVAARDHARRLVELEPGKAPPLQVLGDALLELGEYAQADDALRRMQRLGGIQGLTRVASEERLARWAALHGDTDGARRHLESALATVLALPVPPPEAVAWVRWQLGELAFSQGDYADAERAYRDSLTTCPDYWRALASRGRVRAARGDLAGASEQYERVVRILPDPTFVAALGDLYGATGRHAEATAEYALVEQIGRLGAAGGTLYDRQLALFHADHDLQGAEAYASAAQAYEARRDIYGADAVAWTALKAGRIDAARAASTEALRLGTRDARLLYHAGMIARAAGNEAVARDYLGRALALNPYFDLRQAAVARTTLARLEPATRLARREGSR